MSRGLGHLQRSVLDGLRAAGQEVCFNELCWQVAERTDRVTVAGTIGPLRAGTVAGGFYQAFTRAVAVLADREIRVRKRKFSGLSEFCRLYPFRSLKLEIRSLREVILSFVLRYLQESGVSQFTAAETEAHFLRQLSGDLLAEAEREWSEIRSPILAEAARKDETEGGRLLFGLTVKGDELFAKTGVQHQDSLAHLLRHYERRSPSFEHTRRLRSLVDRIFPPLLRRHANLKRRLYAVADFSQSMRRPRLKTDFEQWMLTDEEARSFLERLPGHQNPSPPKRPGLHSFHSLTPETNTVLSPLLEQLLARDALAPAKFLSC